MSMEKFRGQDLKDIKSTPFGYTLSIIGGKWKMIIMFWLVEYETLRYGELKRCIRIHKWQNA